LWTSILHFHSPGVATVARRLRYSYSWLRLILVVVSTVATPGEWQCKIRTGGVRQLAVANRPNIFQMLLLIIIIIIIIILAHQHKAAGMKIKQSETMTITAWNVALCVWDIM